MPENKKEKVNASAILSKETYGRIKEQAIQSKRSVSSQIAYILEEDLRRRAQDEMDNEELHLKGDQRG